MHTNNHNTDTMPIVRDPAQFNRYSGNRLERLVFNYRRLFICLCVMLSILFGWQATRLTVNAGFDEMIPQHEPYIKNYFDHRAQLGGLGNVVRIVVENVKDDIFDPHFLEITRKVNETVFLTPGVDRAFMKSIWMSAVRWTEVTEDGFRGGPVMPQNYDGSRATLDELRTRIQRAGITGNLVANDYRSIMLVVPLLEVNPATGARLNYGEFSRKLEQEVRQKYEAESGGSAKIHIIGFAKLAGDLIDGLQQMMLYFGIAIVISAMTIFWYTRCVRSTSLVLVCSLIAVAWQLGFVSLLGYQLNPYSALVPFLIFAIGVSHGAQKMNGVMQDIGRGTHRYVAARYTFRRLFLAGLTALLADAVGFGVLTMIDIPVIKDLARVASIGVAVLIITNLLLLPVMLSYVGVSTAAAQRSVQKLASDNFISTMNTPWDIFSRFTERRWAGAAIVVAALLTLAGYMESLHLQTGDLDIGAPELRADSRYNRDVGYVNSHYGLSSDQFIVIAKTPVDGCSEYSSLRKIAHLTSILRETPGVQYVTALPDNVANIVSGLAEGNPKWLTIPRNKGLLGIAVERTLNDNPDAVDKTCSTIPVVAYLADHKAETLGKIVTTVEKFSRENNDDNTQFLLAAGSAGIEAVTNMVVTKASNLMLYYVYGAVILLCFITFRSWRAVIVAVVPLAITSILCEALMTMLGIGVKVATLPVIALGVGIGVDYALYLLSVQLQNQRAGMSLADAYRHAMQSTGKVVALVGVTLAAGVVTWAWSPIKFQADMGILLTFMFLLNMVGALILIPALSCYLLQTKKPS